MPDTDGHPTGAAASVRRLASPGQQALCVQHELDPATPGLALSLGVRLGTSTDEAGLVRALRILVGRHAALRKRFVDDDGHWWALADPVPTDEAGWRRYIDVVTLDADSADGPGEVSARLARQILLLRDGPLFRATLIHHAGRPSHLLVRVHHAVLDLWSVGLLLEELSIVYADADAGTAGAGELWEADEKHRSRARQYWRSVFAEEVESLSLPAVLETAPRDGGQPESRTRAMVWADVDLSGVTGEKITRLARSAGVTPYAALLSLHAFTLGRFTGQSRVPVTVALNGRRRESYRQVGFFVSTAVFPVDVADGTATDLLQRVSVSLRGALAHQSLDRAALAAEAIATGRQPIPPPQAALMLQQDTPGMPAGSAAALASEGASLIGGTVALTTDSTGPFPLSLILLREGDSYRGHVEVDPGRVEPWVARRYARLFEAAARAVVDRPVAALDDLAVLPSADAEQLREWSSARAAPVRGANLAELVLEALRTRAGSIVVSAEDGELSAGDLLRRSAAVADSLLHLGIGTGDRVGVALPRTVDLLAVLLGVVRCGAAYVPLDLATPPARNERIIAESGCAAVIVTARDNLSLGPPRLPVGELLARPAPESAPQVDIEPDDAAYVLFTSGSTGRPKGVTISHRGAVNLLSWAAVAFSAADFAQTLAVTPITFDLSVFEIFAPLVGGGRVHLLNTVLDLVDDPGTGTGSTMINTVPSAVRTLLDRGCLPPSLRVVNMAGEPFPAALVTAVHEQVPSARIFNLYGPSETTTYSTVAELTAGATDPVPIGRPLAGTTLRVVDSALRSLPIGVVGELLIGGSGVALGYLGRPDLTARAFLPALDGDRQYRTGDLVRWRPDGQLEFVGRADLQVKVRGVRIELGDVEQALRESVPLRDVAVCARGSGADRTLVAFLVPDGFVDRLDPRSWVRTLRRELAARVPPALIPTGYGVLDELPRTPHGKVDRRRLAAMPDVGLIRRAPAPPRDETQRRLVTLWRDVLEQDVGVDDDFAEVGGHSLLLTTLSGLIQREFQVRLSLADLWLRRTVVEQASLITERKRSATAEADVTLRPIDRRRYLDVPRGETTS